MLKLVIGSSIIGVVTALIGFPIYDFELKKINVVNIIIVIICCSVWYYICL